MAFSVAPLTRVNRVTAKALLPATPTASAQTFQRLMNQALTSFTGISQTSATAYTVRQGDTLSSICSKALSEAGQAPSSQDVAKAVALVAKANGVSNPDRIQVGQTLNLNPIRSNTAAASGGPHRTTTPSLELTRLIRSITAGTSSEKSAAAKTQNSLKDLIEESSEVSSGYGLRKDPFGGGSDYHSGIDLAAESGSGIHALKSGVVTFSGWQPDYGRIVVVSHADGTETAYAHNSKNLVKAGQRVDANTRIALVGSTGRSTGPHLHFELRRSGKAVDPESDAASLQIAKAL